MDQRTLIERAGKGEQDAFATLLGESLARLDGAARLILRDPELARDAVQEAMVRAWRDLPGLRDPDRFDAWLYRLTVNACLDLARRRRRRVIEVELTSLDEPPTPDGSGGVAMRDQLDRALRQLEPDQRAVIVLLYYLDLSADETAAILGVPLGTVKSRLHRSLARMRIILSDEEATPLARAEGRYA